MSWSGGNGVDGVWVELEVIWVEVEWSWSWKKFHNGGGVEVKTSGGGVEVEEEILNLGTLFDSLAL